MGKNDFPAKKIIIVNRAYCVQYDQKRHFNTFWAIQR